ncbi:MAG: fluoride efflux transporter CrcB [Opitutaceae bacterium]|nr:fluoride efflux transporter CrcB [Opitutaceae bacterium]
MNPATLLLVALGGALGSVLRALASVAVPAGRLPWATIAVNVVGSLVIGWLMARFAGQGEADLRTQSFWIVGVCGGFTTFSAFSWQTLAQLQRGAWGLAAANVLLSLVLCLGATWLGWRLAR